jgi:transcriptional regulator with XRE-family HTH domain
MSFGENLARIRRAKRITQKALAKTIGVTEQAVSGWERGVDSPEENKIPKIAKGLSVSVSLLWDNDPGLSREDREILEIIQIMNPRDKGKWLRSLKAYLGDASE